MSDELSCAMQTENEPPELVRLRKTVRRLLDERRNLRRENDAARKEVARLRAASIHTRVECSAPDCKRGVRNEYAVLGMCVTCAEAELERLRGIERALGDWTPERLREWASEVTDWGTNPRQAWKQLCLQYLADALEGKP